MFPGHGTMDWRDGTKSTGVPHRRLGWRVLPGLTTPCPFAFLSESIMTWQKLSKRLFVVIGPFDHNNPVKKKPCLLFEVLEQPATGIKI